MDKVRWGKKPNFSPNNLLFNITNTVQKIWTRLVHVKVHSKSLKNCSDSQYLLVWFGRPILDTFLLISWDLVHILQNRFLCLNRESEPVDLNTMNPIIRKKFLFTYKGVRVILSAVLDTLPVLGFLFRFLLVCSLITNDRFIWEIWNYFQPFLIFDTAQWRNKKNTLICAAIFALYLQLYD